MSILSKLKRSKEAARVHKQIASEQMIAENIPRPPYKHVPTHALFDSLNAGPSIWKHGDKLEVTEQRAERQSVTSSETSLSSEPESRHHGF
jgi:hypothetical protein